VKALVTRPREDAAELAAALQARGIEAVLEPLLVIRFAEDGAAVLAPLLAGAQAVLFTSANGVRAFAAASPRRDLAAFAVGDATARAARELGFAAVESAGGDVADLAALVQRRLEPAAGALVHAAAKDVAGDLAAALAAAGFELRRAVLYEALPAERLSDATAALLAKGEIALALFFSPRTAALFVSLAAAAGLEGACRAIAAVALSPAVASRLEPLAWRAVLVAATPTLESLLAAADRAVAEAAGPHGSGGGPMTDERTEQTPPPPPAEARPRRRAAWVWLAALLVAIVVVGAAPYWAPLVPWAQNQAASLEALEARVNAAETGRRNAEERLARLEARQQAQPAAAPAASDAAALEGLGRRIEALERRPATSGAAGDSQALTEALQRATARLDAIEARLGSLAAASAASDTAAATDASAVALFAAVAGLRAALAEGGPYQDELAAVAALGHGDAKVAAAVQTLTPDAATGLPNLALLAARFRAATAPAIRRAGAPAAADQGTLAERALARVESLVTIRRVGNGGDAKGDPVAPALAALDTGDLAAAVAALKILDGAAAAAARPWLDLAQRRLGADTAVAALARQTAGRLAAPPARGAGN
jgi:uroporphyrinogen-III synthase